MVRWLCVRVRAAPLSVHGLCASFAPQTRSKAPKQRAQALRWRICGRHSVGSLIRGAGVGLASKVQLGRLVLRELAGPFDAKARPQRQIFSVVALQWVMIMSGVMVVWCLRGPESLDKWTRFTAKTSWSSCRRSVQRVYGRDRGAMRLMSGDDVG